MEIKGKNVARLMIVINMLIVIGALMMQEVNGQGPSGPTICGHPTERYVVCWAALKEPNPQPPTQECCNIIKSSDQKCLCSFITSPMLPLFGIDAKLFLAIFGKCGLPSCP
ncbi:hypothetical protein RND81_10G234000 [Saponaria officinalis]|uniref:Bifunctional inhibitor/plant lipid transfer protein/seed storage helical domain-containing protein n=1 Tax=Saponaria officinalis TaxID=3572 RepID=A0AAW1I7U6_SAPOF